MRSRTKQLAVVLALSQPLTLALAQGPQQPGSGVQGHTAAGANFVCGGVGQLDQQAMKANARQHDLMLTFAESPGAYLADVAVQIRDPRGNAVVDTTCPGPLMLVDLPREGRWRITAQFNGETRERTVVTSAGRTARATFVWPAGTS